MIVSKNKILDFFLENDFEPYMMETFWHTGIVKFRETIPEFIQDMRYAYEKEGYEAFFGMLDDEDFIYFPELRSMIIEWHDPR